MITPIEVLDSAVKIGLGAALTGIATYVMSKVSARHEFAKGKRDLLERISLAAQESAAAISRAMLIIQRLGQTPEDKKASAQTKALEIFHKAIEQHNIAEGLAALIGSADLTHGLNTFGDGAIRLLDNIRRSPEDIEAQDAVINELNASRLLISSAVRKAYEQTAA
jgi:hypothetical protein